MLQLKHFLQKKPLDHRLSVHVSIYLSVCLSVAYWQVAFQINLI